MRGMRIAFIYLFIGCLLVRYLILGYLREIRETEGVRGTPKKLILS